LDLGYQIFFEDESIAHIDPTVKKGWYRKGSKPIQLINGSKKKTTMFGAVSGLKKILMYADKSNLKNFKKFLKMLSRKVGRCILVLDNASWHKSKKAIRYAEKLGIVLYFLPPYSPELNPIEQLWKWIKLNVTYRLHLDMDDVKTSVNRFVKGCDFYVDTMHFMD